VSVVLDHEVKLLFSVRHIYYSNGNEPCDRHRKVTYDEHESESDVQDEGREHKPVVKTRSGLSDPSTGIESHGDEKRWQRSKHGTNCDDPVSRISPGAHQHPRLKTDTHPTGVLPSSLVDR
jgi:hypothetical protein